MLMWDIFLEEAVIGGVSSAIARDQKPGHQSRWHLKCVSLSSLNWNVKINMFSFVKHVLWIIALLHYKQPECS